MKLKGGENNMRKTFKVKAILEVVYEVTGEEYVSDALEVAKGYLLDKIDAKNVAYDELKARLVSGDVDELHKVYKGKVIAKTCIHCGSILQMSDYGMVVCTRCEEPQYKMA